VGRAILVHRAAQAQSRYWAPDDGWNSPIATIVIGLGRPRIGHRCAQVFVQLFEHPTFLVSA
jgi:hypothetical protein